MLVSCQAIDVTPGGVCYSQSLWINVESELTRVTVSMHNAFSTQVGMLEVLKFNRKVLHTQSVENQAEAFLRSPLK